MSSDQSSDIVHRSLMREAKKEAKSDSSFKKLDSRAFYSAPRPNKMVARKLDFDAVAEEVEEPSTARMQLAIEASLSLLAASDDDSKRTVKKRSAKSMGLVGSSPRSPTLSKLQKRQLAMDAQFSFQGGSPFATPHYAQAQSSAKGKRSRDEVAEEGEEDEEEDLQDAIAKRGRGREAAGNLGTSGLLGSFYGPSAGN